MLENEFKKIVEFLNKQKFNYYVIGGIAVGVIGYPRFTKDIDFCIFIKRPDVKKFLDKVEKNRYSVDKKSMIESAKSSGVFHIMDGKVRIDFLIASHQLEKDVLERRLEIILYGIKTYFPTPEDLILLKIVPGRTQDIADAENIARRYSGKLDKEYLETWAQKLSDEAEDMSIYNEIKRLLSIENKNIA